MELEQIVRTVQENTDRIATLGEWPANCDRAATLVGRIPLNGKKAPGFDAGIASALDMIPRESQRLSALLHAAPRAEAIAQARDELHHFKVGSQFWWWLLASKFYRYGGVKREGFLEQVAEMRAALETDASNTDRLAREELKLIRGSYETREGFNGVPFAIRPGGLLNAYIDGFELAVQAVPKGGFFFLGTYRSTLGLEDFEFSGRMDADGRSISGPVGGSPNFVKLADTDELRRALAVAKPK